VRPAVIHSHHPSITDTITIIIITTIFTSGAG
jgi:hypothetical protein